MSCNKLVDYYMECDAFSASTVNEFTEHLEHLGIGCDCLVYTWIDNRRFQFIGFRPENAVKVSRHIASIEFKGHQVKIFVAEKVR